MPEEFRELSRVEERLDPKPSVETEQFNFDPILKGTPRVGVIKAKQWTVDSLEAAAKLEHRRRRHVSTGDTWHTCQEEICEQYQKMMDDLLDENEKKRQS